MEGSVSGSHLLFLHTFSHWYSYHECEEDVLTQTYSLTSLLSPRPLLPTAALIPPSEYDTQNRKLIISKQDLVSLLNLCCLFHYLSGFIWIPST